MKKIEIYWYNEHQKSIRTTWPAEYLLMRERWRRHAYTHVSLARERDMVCVPREFLAVRVIRSFYVRSKKGMDQRANAALLWLRRSRGHGSLSVGPFHSDGPILKSQFRLSHLKTLKKYVWFSI